MCYPCTHCNKCGAYSLKKRFVCRECGKEIEPGTSTCAYCGGKGIMEDDREKLLAKAQA